MEEVERSNTLLRQVIKLEKNKNNYFTNLSHELRTPLNVINSVEQLVNHLNKTEEGITTEKLNYYMDVMGRNTKRLLNLINNIIDASKFEHGSYKLNLEENDIVYTVEEAALSLKGYVESKGIELIIDTDVEEKVILVDPNAMERILLNLLSNAVKFSKPNNQITVTVSDYGESVGISVKDRGKGIPKDKLEVIFERFRQVDKLLSRKQEGSGIGLSLVKSLVTMHGGEIYVESNYGEGSEFIIKLPVNNQSKTSYFEETDQFEHRYGESINIEFSDIYSI